MSKFAFVSVEQANHAVSTLCRVVGVSVSGFYAWLQAIPVVQHRAEADAALRGHIGRIFAARRLRLTTDPCRTAPGRTAAFTPAH